MSLASYLLIAGGTVIGCMLIYSICAVLCDTVTPTAPQSTPDRDSWTDETCHRCRAHYNPSEQAAKCPHDAPVAIYAVGDVLVDKHGTGARSPVRLARPKGEIIYEFRSETIGPYFLRESYFTDG